MKEFKKKLAVILAFCMVLTSTVPAFAATIQAGAETSAQTEDKVLLENDEYEEASPSNTKYEDNILTDEEDIEEVIIEENFEDVALINDTEEVLPAEDEEAEFFAEVKVGNVIITAKAEAGVVPKGTILKAKKVVDKEVKEAIDEVVEEKREDETQVVESLKFDIKLLKDGEEIEPDGLVSLSFALADAAANAEANIYHIIEDEETKELVEAEVLDVETVEEPEDETTLVLETEVPGFSYYVVEFTVGELQYVLEGDSSVKLSEILAELKIEGTVKEAVSGAPELFSVEKDATGDDWTVTALKAFSTEEWMKVTVDGKEYKIIVTDTITVASILPTGFPTDSNSNWKNTNGEDYRIYVSNSRLYLYVSDGTTKEVLEKTVEESNVEPLGSDYRYENSVGTIVLFKMSNGKLASIKISGTGLTDYNGTYEPPRYTVHFDGHGHSGGSMADQIMTYGEAAKLNQNGFNAPGDAPFFAGWADDPTAAKPKYADQQLVKNLVTPSQNEITLYAIWMDSGRSAVIYSVNVNMPEGGNINRYVDVWNRSSEYPEGCTATAKEGYKFVGWKDAEGNLIDDDTVDVTVSNDGKTITPRVASTKNTYYTAFFEKQKTIADILPEDFPTTEAAGWVNEKDAKVFLNDNMLTFKASSGEPIEFDKSKIVTFLDGYYVYGIPGTVSSVIKFMLDEEKLGSISSELSDPLGGTYVPLTYKVTYDANSATSGNVPTDSTKYAPGTTVTVLGNTGSLTKTGYTFDGWNTKTDGSGTHYDSASTFQITANTTLYAEWKVQKTIADILALSVTPFPTVEGSGWVNDQGTRAYIDANQLKFTTSGRYNFAYDLTTPVTAITDGYEYSNSDVTILFNKSDGVLTSISIPECTYDDGFKGEYRPASIIKYKVQFLIDGNVYEEQTVMNGERATRPANPLKPGCEFAGWYTDGTEYDFDKPVTNDITLYAKWVVVPRATITGLTADKPVYKVGDTIKLTATIDGPDGTEVFFDVSGKEYVLYSYKGNAVIEIPLPFTNPGDYTITASLRNGSNKIITITVKQGSTPDPKKKESSSGTYSLFTGTTGNPVTNGKWTKNADGTWSYATSRKFTNTWGYIANSNDANSAAWYYFDRNGNMLTKWQKLYWNGAYRWYYFSQTKDSNEGKCQLGGITPDGYKVGPDGAWIED